ncbi:MAG: rhomboid family intramembrane serine protease [Candidatus Aenigmatarchaeota archaeon]
MKLTLFLIFLCVVGFIFPILFVADLENFANVYGFSGKNLFERPYVLVTSIFLHADITHLLSNILVLFFFGIAVESELGKKKTLAIFFLGAFLGDLLSLLVYPPDAIAIGASGGIFALIGAGILVRPLDLSFYPLVLPIPLALIGLMYAFYNAYDFMFAPESNISYIAHFGGLFVGLLYGFRREGVRKSLKIILLFFAIMILIPILWTILF